MISKNKKTRIIFITVSLLLIGGIVSLIFQDKIKTAVIWAKRFIGQLTEDDFVEI